MVGGIRPYQRINFFIVRQKHKQYLISKCEQVSKHLFDLEKIDNNPRLTKYYILWIFYGGQFLCMCMFCFLYFQIVAYFLAEDCVKLTSRGDSRLVDYIVVSLPPHHGIHINVLVCT